MKKLSAKDLSLALGISTGTIFRLRRQYPKDAPKSFSAVEKWRSFALGHTITPEAPARLVR